VEVVGQERRLTPSLVSSRTVMPRVMPSHPNSHSTHASVRGRWLWELSLVEVVGQRERLTSSWRCLSTVMPRVMPSVDILWRRALAVREQGLVDGCQRGRGIV